MEETPFFAEGSDEVEIDLCIHQFWDVSWVLEVVLLLQEGKSIDMLYH